MAELARFRKEEETPAQASLRELKRNVPLDKVVDAAQAPGRFIARGMGQLADATLLAPLRGDFSAFAPSTYINAIADSSAGRSLDASMQAGQSTLGMPEASVREAARVRTALNPGGSGVIQETVAPAVAAAVPQVARGLAQAAVGESSTAAPPLAAPALSTQAPELQASPRNDQSFRIVRREGHSPLLTNVADPISEVYKGENFIETDGRRTDFIGGVPEGYSPADAVPVAPSLTPAARSPRTAEESLVDAVGVGRTSAPRAPRTVADFLSGVRVPRGGEEAALGMATRFARAEAAAANREENLMQRDRSFDLRERQTDINQQVADASTANAGVAGLRAQVELAKLNKELGANLEPVFEEVPLDPANPLLGTTKTITGFASKGGSNPVYIPQGAMQEYRAARAAATTPEELKAVEDEFRTYYQLGR